jgi:hypothetical protein
VIRHGCDFSPSLSDRSLPSLALGIIVTRHISYPFSIVHFTPQRRSQHFRARSSRILRWEERIDCGRLDARRTLSCLFSLPRSTRFLATGARTSSSSLLSSSSSSAWRRWPPTFFTRAVVVHQCHLIALRFFSRRARGKSLKLHLRISRLG